MQAHEGHTRIVTDEFLRETIPHGSEEYSDIIWRISGSLIFTASNGTGIQK